MLALFLAATLAVSAPPPDSFNYFMKTLTDESVAINKREHINPFAYVDRLDKLQQRIQDTDPPRNPNTPGDLQEQARLEFQLARQLLGNPAPALPHAQGAIEYFTSAPGDRDSVGVYVPSAPSADGSYRLVMILHGAGEPETDVIAATDLRNLADRQHAILVAPWGGGDDLWGQASENEVMALIDRMQQSYRIDDRRIYLAGISMGGAGALHIGARHPSRFAAIMSIVGDLAGPDVHPAQMAFRTKPVYLVMGKRDPIMGPVANAATVRYLARACVPYSSYMGPGGHEIFGNLAQMTQAWQDMFAGTVRNRNDGECTGGPSDVAN